MTSAHRIRWSVALGVTFTGFILSAGCHNSPVDVSDKSRGPAPLRLPSIFHGAHEGSYEDNLQGHRVFAMYCSQCHNARALAERPFSNYQNVAQHMRVRANLTGKEYAVLIAWMRRWHDVPPPEQRVAPSPKRFFFGQPIPELKQEQPRAGIGPVSGPRPGAMDEVSPGQPQPGNAPREAR